MKEFIEGNLKVRIYDTGSQMDYNAAEAVSNLPKLLISFFTFR